MAVEIKEVTPPNLWHCQHIYHVMFVDHEGSHDTPYNNLFVSHDYNDALDPRGLLVAKMDRLRIPAALDA